MVSGFKSFYWLKSVVNDPELISKKFSANCVSESIKSLGNEIFKLYAGIPSIEIWNDSTISSILKQVKYYWESGIFESREIAIQLLEELEEEINLVEKQAELSRKLLSTNKPAGEPNTFTMYYSEIEIGNNCILTSLNDNKSTYLSHSTFNKIVTLNQNFCTHTEEWINNLIKKSALISGVSEKQRYQYFRGIKEQITNLKNSI